MERNLLIEHGQFRQIGRRLLAQIEQAAFKEQKRGHCNKHLRHRRDMKFCIEGIWDIQLAACEAIRLLVKHRSILRDQQGPAQTMLALNLLKCPRQLVAVYHSISPGCDERAAAKKPSFYYKPRFMTSPVII